MTGSHPTRSNAMLLQSRAGTGHRALALALTFVMSAAAFAVGVASPAAAEVTAVGGNAYGYFADVAFFGQPQPTRGPTPTVTLPPEGSAVPITDSVSSGLVLYGPAYLFSSGPITVSTQGTTGAGGSVTSSTDINTVNTSGNEKFTADRVQSTCTASETGLSGSTTITNGILETSEGDPDVEGDETRVTIPTNPDPNTEYSGVIETVGDNFRIVFNEQIVNPDGSWTVNAIHWYLLGPNAVGEVIIGSATCGPLTTVEAPNTAPVAVDDTYSTPYDSELTVPAPGVLANDSDADGDALTAEMLSTPANGTLTLNPNGSFTYTPNAGFSGADTFTYMAHDPSGGMDTATVTVTVASDAPADNDFFADATVITGPEGVVFDSNVGATTEPGEPPHPSGAGGGNTIWFQWTAPADGGVTFDPCGSFFGAMLAVYTGDSLETLTPVGATTFSCDDPIAFTATAGTVYYIQVDSFFGGTGNVQLNWRAGNQAPVAVPDGYFTTVDTPLTVDAPGVLANDTDGDGDTLTAELFSQPDNGSVVLNPDGSFTYTPAPGNTNSTTFNYTVSDGNGGTDFGDVTINFIVPDTDGDGWVDTTDNCPDVANPGQEDADNDGVGDACEATPNNPPEALNDEYNTQEDTPLTVDAPGVLANDIDPDGDPLTALEASDPAGGTVVLNPDGSFTYTPDPGFEGQDQFSYMVHDSHGASDPGLVVIFVQRAFTDPVGVPDAYSTPYQTPLSVPAPGVLANDSDADGDALSAFHWSGPANGTVVLNEDGSFLYTPNAGFSGTDTFRYYVGDSSGAISSGFPTVTLTVATPGPANDDFADAQVITGNTGSVSGSTVRATSEPGEPSHGQGAGSGTSIWYQWTAPGTGDVDFINTCGSVPESTFSVYTGTSLATLTPVSESAFGCGQAGQFTATGGTTYYIAVDGQFGSTGSTVLNWFFNRAPEAADDAYSTSVGSPLTVPAPGVLGNDTDPDGNEMTAELLTTPSNGTVTLNEDGSFTYTPAAGFSGTDTFTYSARDQFGDNSPAATVTITVATPGPANADACKSDGWKSFNNPAFKNQGQCVSYANARSRGRM